MSIVYQNGNSLRSEVLENAFVFLALDEAAYLNDVVLSVDAMART